MRDDDGGRLLDPILDDGDDAHPGDEPAAPRARRRRTVARGPALAAVLALLTGALGLAGGWRLGSASTVDDEGAAVRATDASAATTTTPPANPPTTSPPMPPYAAGATAAVDGHWVEPGWSEDVELVGRRVTADGVTVRTYRPTGDGCHPGSWCPPPECRSGSGVTVGVSTDRMVGSGGSHQRPPVASPAMYIGGWAPLGLAEDDPVLWVGAYVPEGAVIADLVIDGQRRDRADVDRRWAALAARHELEQVMVESDHDVGATYQAPRITGIEVVARDGAGRVLGRMGLDQTLEDQIVRLPSQCEPPGPPLSAPGEQPPDPDAARAAVRAAYEQAWNHTSTRDQKLAAIHDPRGVESAMERAAAGYGTAVGSTLVEVGEIVFTSPIQAQLHFRLTYEGAPSLGNRLGGAVLVDGRWLVLRSSYCEVLSLAGAACGSP